MMFIPGQLHCNLLWTILFCSTRGDCQKCGPENYKFKYSHSTVDSLFDAFFVFAPLAPFAFFVGGLVMCGIPPKRCCVHYHSIEIIPWHGNRIRVSTYLHPRPAPSGFHLAWPGSDKTREYISQKSGKAGVVFNMSVNISS